MWIKGFIRSFLNQIGYDLRNIKPGGAAYPDQRGLLVGREVWTIFDIGANVGQTALAYRKLFPGATIYSFEPFESSYQALVRNCRRDQLIRPYRLAITSFTGTRPLYYNKFSPTNSLLPVSDSVRASGYAELMRNLGIQEVSSITLDEFCVCEGIDSIQILKMDIQGGELMALGGAVHLLASRSVDLIYTEVLFAEFYEGQAYFLDLCQFLQQHGYSLSGLYDLRYGGRGRLAWGDAIFLSPRVSETTREPERNSHASMTRSCVCAGGAGLRSPGRPGEALREAPPSQPS